MQLSLCRQQSWHIQASMTCNYQASLAFTASTSAQGINSTSSFTPKTEQSIDRIPQRASRAAALVHLGELELSAAARALVAEPLAPGTGATLAELRDPARRLPEPYAALAPDVAAFQPAEACPLPASQFLASLRGARRGAAAGPSAESWNSIFEISRSHLDPTKIQCLARIFPDGSAGEAGL